jgi:hypothetical protein
MLGVPLFENREIKCTKRSEQLKAYKISGRHMHTNNGDSYFANSKKRSKITFFCIM